MFPRVLLIDNYDSFTYNLKQILDTPGICTYKIIKNNLILETDFTSFDKILISPGPGLPPEIPGLIEFIKTQGLNKRVLGICLGHQAIAQAFGAELINLKQVNHGIREKITITDENDYLFKDLPLSFEVGLYHSWTVNPSGIPDCFKITSISEDGIIMSISHRKYDIKGIQFHPESIMTVLGQKIIENWLKYG